jgi:hypothetical protein
MVNVLVKVHESYRWVVAVCDEDVFGRKLSEGNRVLDVSGVFFEGKVMNEEDAEKEIVRCASEDATFNFVGEKSVDLAKKLGFVKESGVMNIDGIPFALVLL